MRESIGTDAKADIAGDDLRDLFHAAPTPFVMLSGDRRVEAWNAAAERLFGWRAEQVVGRRCPLCADAGAVDSGFRPAYEAAFAAALSGRHPDPFQTWRQAPDGDTVALRVHAKPRPSRGGVLFLFERTSDDSALRDRLRRETRRFEFLARMSGDWIWETDLDQRFLYVSQHASDRIFPRPLEEYVGRTRWELLESAGIDPDPIASRVAAAMRAGESFNGIEYTYDHPERGRVHIRFSGHPFRDDAGRIAGYRGIGSDVTERRRKEASYADAAKLLEQAASLAGLGYWIWDARPRRCIDCSETTAAQHGLSREAFLRHNEIRNTSTDLMVGDDGARYMETVWSAVRARTPYRIEYRVRRLDDGDVRFIEEYGEPIFDADGELSRIVGSTQDVTASRRETDDARENERQYRTLANIAAQLHMITQFDAEGRPSSTWSAGRIEGVVEVDPGRGCRDCVLDLYTVPDDRPILAERKRRLQEGEDTTDELRLKADGGPVRWVRAYGRAEHDASGRLVRIFEACEDVTDAKRMRRELEQRDARIRRVAENLPGAVFQETVAADGTGEFAFIFGGLRRRLGLPEDASGGRWAALVDPQDAEALRSDTAAAAATGGSVARDVRLRGPSGETLWTRLSKRARDAPGHDGRTTFDGVMIDITEQRASEQRVRTAEKLESLGTLAGGVAHDFNNLLQSILFLTEDLLQDAIDPGARESLEAIAESSRQGREIVRHILDFARKDAEGEPEVMDPRPMLRDCLRIAAASLPPTVRIERDDAPTACVRVDPAHFHQIAHNLVRNAAQACAPHGRVSVRLSEQTSEAPLATVDRELMPGRYVVLSVEDDGPGIAPADQQRIFEPFFSTKSTGDASGMGLSVVLGHVDRHGGGIRLASAPGEGARFDVLLPAADGGAGKTPST